jgi:hypothetical protein
MALLRCVRVSTHASISETPMTNNVTQRAIFPVVVMMGRERVERGRVV